MEKININQYIIKAFQKHDEVIITGLGRLQAELELLLVNPGNGTIAPDKKSITSFNQDPSVVDNQLVEMIAEGENISILEAQDTLREWVSELSTNTTTYLPNIGTFYVSNTGQISFNKADDNILLENFGLPILNNAVPLSQETPLPPSIVKPKVTPNRVVNPWIATIKKYQEVQLALLLIVVLILLIPITYQLSNRNSTPVSTELTPPPSEAELEETIENPLLTDDYLEEQLAEETTPIPVEPNTPPTPTPSAADVDNFHFAVVGTFSQKANADDMVKEIFRNGYNANMRALPNNMYRVSILIDKNDDLNNELKKVKADYPKAWVLKN